MIRTGDDWTAKPMTMSAIDYRAIAARQALERGACPRCIEKWGAVPLERGESKSERGAYAEHMQNHVTDQPLHPIRAKHQN